MVLSGGYGFHAGFYRPQKALIFRRHGLMVLMSDCVNIQYA